MLLATLFVASFNAGIARGHEASPLRRIGTVTLLSGPSPCEGEDCYFLDVVCPEVDESIQVTVKVAEPLSSPVRGTTVFMTGWIGNYWWDESGMYAAGVLDDLVDAGYRTVQIRWENNWFRAPPGENDEGLGELACRPATVLLWIYDTIHAAQVDLPFCGTGHSNGAAQLAYAMTQYGLGDLFSAALFESGPNWFRLDHACLHDDPSMSPLFFPATERQIADWAFGFNGSGGPCDRQDSAFRELFRNASIGWGDWQYVFEHTMLGFQFGEFDTGTTARHGEFFRDWLISAGTPLIRSKVIPGAGHFTVNTAEGGDAVREFFITGCHLRTCPEGGMCGDPVDAGRATQSITASDALFVLRAAVGLVPCDLCICDVDESGAVAATDALELLRVSVGLGPTPHCKACLGW
ncbi:MAG: hypothetical protein D6815_08545 [Candidatus Dadabacteria bacterium]|nr:MAG: hypothetical protein D6815_08545 [Candidatus Dadabacteria bacterium]